MSMKSTILDDRQMGRFELLKRWFPAASVGVILSLSTGRQLSNLCVLLEHPNCTLQYYLVLQNTRIQCRSNGEW
jgi:hypothetical protein